jgi:hypothetical protein
MRFHNRATDGKAHAQAIRLAREKRFEQTFDLLGLNANARIPHRDAHRAGLRRVRLNVQETGAVRNSAQRIERVRNEIQEHLLQLHAICRDGWKSSRKLGLQCHIAPEHFRLRKGDDFLNQFVDVELCPGRLAPFQQRANSHDDIARPIPVADDAPGRIARLV